MGSSRIAYNIDNEWILKLAKNQKGLAQNRAEVTLWEQVAHDVYAKFLPRIEEHDDDYRWIITELCPKIKPTEFRTAIGMDFGQFEKLVQTLQFDNNPRLVSRGDRKTLYRVLDEEGPAGELLQFMEQIVYTYGGSIGDFKWLVNYGKNRAGSVVLIDTGLTDSIYERFYSDKHKDLPYW